jgi:hypothetical protein
LKQSAPVNSTQPSAAERSGDFSCFLSGGSCATSAKGTTIVDPTTGQPFPGNVIGEHNTIVVLGWTHTFSPSLLLDFYVSYLHLPLYRDAQNYKTDFAAIIPGLGPQLLEGAPTLNITNITNITESGSKNLEQTYQGNTAITKVWPKHTVKAGFSYLFDNAWQDNSQSHGSFTFTTRLSRLHHPRVQARYGSGAVGRSPGKLVRLPWPGKDECCSPLWLRLSDSVEHSGARRGRSLLQPAALVVH